MMAAALCVLACVLFGCGPSIDDYYPLKVGNKWRYRTTYPDGRVLTDVDQIIRRVEQTYTFNNGEVLIRLGGKALLNRHGLRILRYPLRAGNRWEDRDIRLDILSAGDTVLTPAGEFHETLTTVWKTERRAPLTMSADEFVQGPPPADPALVPPHILEAEENKDYPMRRFVSTTIFAKGVGPVKYILDAAELGKPLRNILISELVSYELR